MSDVYNSLLYRSGTALYAEDTRALDKAAMREAADYIAALTARLAAAEADAERLRNELRQKELVHVGYTNGYQIQYAKEESGSFYPDTENQCHIPLYMLAIHRNRLEIGPFDAARGGE